MAKQSKKRFLKINVMYAYPPDFLIKEVEIPEDVYYIIRPYLHKVKVNDQEIEALISYYGLPLSQEDIYNLGQISAVAGAKDSEELKKQYYVAYNMVISPYLVKLYSYYEQELRAIAMKLKGLKSRVSYFLYQPPQQQQNQQQNVQQQPK
jgi:hypothetical protein